MQRILLLTFLLLTAAPAQTYRFHHLGIEQGMSQSSVMHMVQDRDGFLWLATWDGLNRYDGYSFVQYRHDPEDSSTLSNNSIISMQEAPDGSLWIGTAHRGINRLDRRTGRVDRLPLLPDHEVGPANLTMLGPTTLGVASKHGLLQYATEAPFRPPVYDRDPEIACCVLRSADGTVWTARQFSMTRRAPDGSVDKIPLHAAELGIPASSSILSLTEDRYGRLWVSMQGGGLLEFDRERSVFVQPHFGRIGLVSPNVRFVMEDSQGRFWIGTENGLFQAQFTGEGRGRRISGFTRYTHDVNDPWSLTNNVIFSMVEDRSGVLWIGTQDGLNKLLPERKKFTTIGSASGTGKEFRNMFPIAIETEGDSVLWAGTTKDLFRYTFRGDRWKKFSVKNSGLSSEGIYRLLRDSRGRLWCATKYGLNLFDPKQERFRSIIFPGDGKEQIWENKMLDLIEAPGGTIWVATIRGGVWYDPATGAHKRVLNEPPIDSVKHRYLLSLSLNGDHLYAGTNARGLVRLRLPQAEIDTVLFPVDENHPGAAYMDLYRSRNGILWAATMGQGLLMVDDRNGTIITKRYTTKQGLPNDFAYGILEDEDGNLWISTNAGLAQFDPHTEQFRVFTTKDGLPTNEFNQNSFHRASDGTMYFGGVGGVVRFHPRQIRYDTLPPPVAVVNFSVANHPRPELLAAGSARLGYTENFFSFEFSALSFEVPENNQYRYRLEGLEEEWNDAGTRRFANYTDIDPGEYTFRVIASNADGVWNMEGASFRVEIVPPFWATLWFRLLTVSVLIGGVVGSVRYAAHRKYRRQIEELEQQRRILEERQRTRDTIARDLHDDLASTVGSAGLFVETARRTIADDPQQSNEFLTKASSILTEAEEAMSDIVWSVSPKHDTLQSLVTRIRTVTTDLCRAQGLSSAVTTEGDLAVPLSDAVRRGFYLIFKEAVNNTIKHAGASSVTVIVELEGHVLRMSLQDDGRGFTVDGQHDGLGGNGVANIRKRAAEMHAQAEIVSAPGKGTTVTVRLELTQMSH